MLEIVGARVGRAAAALERDDVADPRRAVAARRGRARERRREALAPHRRVGWRAGPDRAAAPLICSFGGRWRRRTRRTRRTRPHRCPWS